MKFEKRTIEAMVEVIKVLDGECDCYKWRTDEYETLQDLLTTVANILENSKTRDVEQMKVFIVMDTTENTGRESIIGVFQSLEKAKIALANYILDEQVGNIDLCYVDIVECTVE